MDEVELKSLSKKCRCCLHEVSNQETLNIGEIVREKFYEMTQFQMSQNSKLSQLICYGCFSILSRYSALKKGFIENQNILNNLLKKCENSETSDFYIRIEAIDEHKGTDCADSQDVKALRNLEELYHVEEFDDKQPKSEKNYVEVPERIIFCEACSKTFNNQRTFKEHKDRIHLQLKKHHCDQCDYSCFSSYELRRHKITRHKFNFSPQKKFLCDICAVEFAQNSCLIRHKKAHHLKITRFECDICSHKTFKKENLIRHMNIHLPNSVKNLFKCSKCPAQLTSHYILKMHEKNVHKQHQKAFHCPYPNCEKSFSREGSLKEHQKFVHLKIRPVSCDKCDMSFSSKSHMMRHQKRKHLNSNNLLVINNL